MDVLAKFYPALDQRHDIPPFYLPTALTFTALPFILTGTLQTRLLASLLPLTLLLLAGPFFTTGSALDDYSLASILYIYLFNYIENVFYPPYDQEMRYDGKGIKDCETFLDRVKWSFRLVTTTRGIGWNWQVKGVPAQNDAHLSRFQFAGRRLILAAKIWAWKGLFLYFFTLLVTLKNGGVAESGFQRRSLDAAIGWMVLALGFNGVQVTYNMAAASTVVMGICKPADWPPFFGKISDAWSVRQLWGSLWHQCVRRMCQQPSIRVARYIGLQKGSFQSKYFQLYFSFFLSMVYHAWLAFTLRRGDAGEYWFFLAQPVAISCEDFVQYCWHRALSAHHRRKLGLVEYAVGWTWTFLWFSYSFTTVLNSFVDGDMLSGESPAIIMKVAQQHARVFL